MEEKKTILPTRKCIEYVYHPWPSEKKITQLISEGWEKTRDREMFTKTKETPMYSAQVNPKHIGNEPNYGQSIHEHCYYTHYYEVERSEYEAMEVKPQLTEQYRAARYHNFDGFVDMIQEERKGMGWQEQRSDYHSTHTYVYFIKG